MKENYIILNKNLLEDNTIEQFKKCMEVKDSIGVLNCDGHYGSLHPIGGVIGYKEAISLFGVGYDIGCGNNAIKLYTTKKPNREQIQSIYDKICFGTGSNNKKPLLEYLDGSQLVHKLIINFFEELERSDNPLIQAYKHKALDQMGTIGSGNHFVNIMIDGDDDHIWLANHFGSRGFGYQIANHVINNHLGLPLDKKVHTELLTEIPLLDVNSEVGIQYINAMYFALKFAHLSRSLVLEFIKCEFIKMGLLDTYHTIKNISNHHNFVAKESYKGKDYWVVRKGATKINESFGSFIGSSMLDKSYIVTATTEPGNELEKEKEMWSTVHGAGRVLSRSAAKKVIDYDDTMKQAKELGITILGGEADEAPGVYKNILEVLDYQLNISKTIKIQHTLLPFVSMMSSGRGKRR